MASRSVSVTLSANVAAYIAGMQAAAAATQNVIGANGRLTISQQQAARAAAQQAAAARAAAQAQQSAAQKALTQQQQLGRSMANDIARQTQLANLQGQAIAENAARDKEAAAKRIESQKKVGVAAAAAGAILIAGFAVSVNKAAEFEQAMSHVEAVTHASARAQNELKLAALDAGARTVFTATESANAIEELAKAGVSTADILNGGLNGALALASAGSLGVAQAAEIGASALVQFGLSGDKMTHVADLLSAGANKAQGSVQDLGVGLSYVGPVAASMGISIEQTTGALALFANNGILAEKGGTALRGILLSLTSPSKRAAEELDHLGINLYNKQGAFVGINGAAEQLRQHLSGLSDEERNYALGVIFSNAQVTSANVLLKGGAAAVNDWTKKVNDQGNAAETARLKLDNLRGDVEKLGGALDNAFITTGSGGLNPLRSVTQGITGVVNAYGNLSNGAKGVAFVIAGTAGAAALASGAFLVLAPRILATRAAMAQLATTAPRTTAAMRGLGTGFALFAGLAIIGQSIGSLGSQGVKAAPGINATTNALLELRNAQSSMTSLDALFNNAQGATFSTDHIKNFEDAVKRLGDPSLRDRIGGLDATLISVGTRSQPRLVEAKKGFDSLDQSLTQLVQGGRAEEAAQRFDLLATRAEKVGVSTDKLKKLLPDYTDALAGAATASGDAATAQTKFGTAADNTTQAIADERKASEQLSAAISALNGGTTDVTRAQIDLKSGLADLTKHFKGHADTVSINNARGRENLTVILDQIDKTNKYAQAVADQASNSMDQASAVNAGRVAFQGQISTLRDTLIAAGLTKTQVDRLITTYGKVPSRVQTDVQVFGEPAARTKIAGLTDGLKGIPPYTKATLQAQDEATPIIASVLHSLGLIPAAKNVQIISQYTTLGTPPPGIAAAPKHAAGGIIIGPGGPRDDMVPALLSNGEFVVNAAATARHRSLLQSINAHRFADGGLVPTPLTSISTQLQAQVQIVTSVRSTATDVARAAAAVQRLQQAWKDTAAAIDQARQRRELLYAIDQADLAHQKALKTKDKTDDVQTHGQAVEARKQLRDFDDATARQKQSDRNDARATAAQNRASAIASLAANKATFEFDHKTAAEQVAALDARIKGEKKFSDQWLSDTQQREQIQATIAADAKKAADDAAAAAQKIADNKAAFELDHMSAADQITEINRRIAGETQFSDAWITLATQRENIQKQIDADAKAAIDKQKQAVDDQATKLSGLLDQQAQLTAQLSAAQATYDKAVAGITTARAGVLATVDLTQNQSVVPGASINNLLRNANASNAQFDEWVQQLALARANGVSDAVIKSLGLDLGPQALGQLRQLNKATSGQVGQLNTAVSTRQAAAAAQAGTEAKSGTGQVADDIKAAADALVASQTDLNTQLTALGVDTGRSYADAIAQGLASGQAGVRAAALSLIGGTGALDTLRGVPQGTTAAGFAAGGTVRGPGSGTSDSVPAWLSNGEFVVRAAAVAQHRSLLETINAGHYADGGYVAGARVPTRPSQVNVSAEVETYALQMEIRRVAEGLDRQTGVIRGLKDGTGMALTGGGWDH